MNRIEELERELDELQTSFRDHVSKFACDANQIIISWIKTNDIPEDLRFPVLMYYNHYLDDLMLELSYHALIQEDFQSFDTSARKQE